MLTCYARACSSQKPARPWIQSRYLFPYRSNSKTKVAPPLFGPAFSAQTRIFDFPSENCLAPSQACRMNTYTSFAGNSRRMNTYTKTGEGGRGDYGYLSHPQTRLERAGVCPGLLGESCYASR